MSEPARISVVVPSYNHARFLRRRLDTILAQTRSPHEVLVLDDASTDDSRSIIEEYAARGQVRPSFNRRNSGSPFKQWNLGLRSAAGDYVWIAESDDYADPRLLERLGDALDANPSAALAYCQSWKVDDCDRVQGDMVDWTAVFGVDRWRSDYVAPGRAEIEEYMLLRNIIPNASAVLFRAEAARRAGGADESLRLAGDWKFWISLAMRGDVAYVAERLNYHRFHSGSVRSKVHREAVWFEEGLGICEFVRKSLSISPSVWDHVFQHEFDRVFVHGYLDRAPRGVYRRILCKLRRLDARFPARLIHWLGASAKRAVRVRLGNLGRRFAAS